MKRLTVVTLLFAGWIAGAAAGDAGAPAAEPSVRIWDSRLLRDANAWAHAEKDTSIALVPLARYDPQYARALGKWMLNLANAARLFYSGALPPGHETSAFWRGDPQGVIAYEGLRYEWLGKRPCATGDPVALNWGPKTDLGLYGSSYVGMLGALIRPTNEPYILQLDCLATDFFRDRAYPTFLYFNPHPEPRTVVLPLDERPVCVYDAVAKKFVVERAQRTVCVSVPADGAALLVVAPADGVVRREGRKLLVDEVVVDYHAAVEGDR